MYLYTFRITPPSLRIIQQKIVLFRFFRKRKVTTRCVRIFPSLTFQGLLVLILHLSRHNKDLNDDW